MDRNPAAGAGRDWQDSGMGSLMLLDSASMYFRAFYGVKETMTAPDGTPVNAVRGFLDMVARLVRGRRPDQVIACLDLSWRPAFRVAAIPSYKSHRANPDGSEQIPDDLTVQVPILLDVLVATGIGLAGADGYEADDIIGTLAAAAQRPVEVVTGDRDLFQVVADDRRVTVDYIGKGVANLEIYDESAVAKKYDIPGRSYAAFAALRGDPSDGLPGVPGVGEKTAAALIRSFGSVEAIIAALDAGHGGFPAGSRAKLAAARPYLAACKPVVTVAAEGRGQAEGGWLPSVPADPGRVADLDQRWDLGSSLGRMLSALASDPA